MERLDSYIEDVLRCCPFKFCTHLAYYKSYMNKKCPATFGRRVLKSMTLSNNHYIPSGVIIETASEPIYRDPEI